MMMMMMVMMKLTELKKKINSVDVPSFVSLFSGSPNEPLYFQNVTEKGAASENHSDPYGHFISAGETFLKRFCLSLARSRNASKKEYQLLPTEIVFSGDKVFKTYVEFPEYLHIDTTLIFKFKAYFYCYFWNIY